MEIADAEHIVDEEDILKVDGPEVTREILRFEAYAEATLRIANQFGSKVPVDEIIFDRMYFEDTEEVLNQWRIPRHREWISLDWWALRKNQSKRVDVTIRCRDFLCGLMMAKRSKNRFCVTVRYLEGNPNHHPLSGYVLPISLIVAESFAYVYGIRNVLISRPEKALLSLYVRSGYALNTADKERQKRNSNPRAKLMAKVVPIKQLM